MKRLCKRTIYGGGGRDWGNSKGSHRPRDMCAPVLRAGTGEHRDVERDAQLRDEARQKWRQRGGDSSHPRPCPASPAASEGKSMEGEDEGAEVRARILAPRVHPVRGGEGGFIF